MKFKRIRRVAEGPRQSWRTEARLALRVMRRSLGEIWRSSPGLFLLSGCLVVVTALVPIASSYFTGQGINELTRAVTRHDVAPMTVYVPFVLAFAMTFINFVLRPLQRFSDDLINERLEVDTTRKVNLQMTRLDLATLEDPAFKTLTAKSSGRYQSAYRRMTTTLFSLTSDAIQLVTAVVLLARVNGWALVIMVVAVVPGAVMSLRHNRKLDQLWDDRGEDQMLQMRTSNMLQAAESNTEIRLNGAHLYLIDLVTRLQHRFRGAQRSLHRKDVRNQSLASLLEEAGRGGVELWLISRVLAGGFGIGTYTFYSSLLGRVQGAASGLLGEVTSVHDAALVLNSLYQVLDYEPKIVWPMDGRRLPVGFVGRIEFQRVSFRYPDAAVPVFEGLNMVIEPGQKVALVGENGAGKSTFVKLLARLYDVDEGRILIDGTDLRELDLPSWRENLGILIQDFNRYPYTVRENIVLGRIEEQADGRRVSRSVKQADAEGIVANWPQGLEQTLGRFRKDGTQVSGGQWQRLALARAFFRDAGTLVLDEPTAAVDARAEAEIFRELMAHQEGKTTIIISHRFSTVRRADRIYVIEAGRLIEQGTHAELMKVPHGVYHELFELQAEGYR